MEEIVSNGIQIKGYRLFSVRRYVFSGWFLSVLLHAVILLVLFFHVTGQVGLFPVSQNSEYRQVGIMLLPAELSQEEITRKKHSQENNSDSKNEKKVDDSSEVEQKSVELKSQPSINIPGEKSPQPDKKSPDVKIVSESQLVTEITESGKNHNGEKNVPPDAEKNESASPVEETVGSLEKNETIFFGLKDKGVRFVYLIDVSASMEGIAIGRVKKEMVASLKHLKADQFFQILFFNRKTFSVKIRRKQIHGMYRASKMNQSAAGTIIKKIQTDGGTQYLSAVEKALRLNPDVIYLLSDAGLPGLSAGDLNDLKEINRGMTRIHTVEFGKTPEINNGNNFLRRLSEQNSGQYRYYHVRN